MFLIGNAIVVDCRAYPLRRPWRERLLLPSELSALLRDGQQGTINQSIDVPPEDLREGSNTLEIIAAGPESGYPAAVTNIDLLLYRDGG